MITRRVVLAGGVAALVAGCSAPDPVAPAPTSRSAPPVPDFAGLEQRFGGRVGVYAVDTGSGAELRYRADERFLLCSTHKVLAVGAILRSGSLDRVIPIDRSAILPNSPITGQHIGGGMTSPTCAGRC